MPRRRRAIDRQSDWRMAGLRGPEDGNWRRRTRGHCRHPCPGRRLPEVSRGCGEERGRPPGRREMPRVLHLFPRQMLRVRNRSVDVGPRRQVRQARPRGGAGDVRDGTGNSRPSPHLHRHSLLLEARTIHANRAAITTSATTSPWSKPTSTPISWSTCRTCRSRRAFSRRAGGNPGSTSCCAPRSSPA